MTGAVLFVLVVVLLMVSVQGVAIAVLCGWLRAVRRNLSRVRRQRDRAERRARAWRDSAIRHELLCADNPADDPTEEFPAVPGPAPVYDLDALEAAIYAEYYREEQP